MFDKNLSSRRYAAVLCRPIPAPDDDDLNFTSNSISILRPIRPQLHVQFDLNYTSNSISVIRPIRPQFYVQFDLNYTSNSKPMGQLFFADGTELGGHETPTPDNTIIDDRGRSSTLVRDRRRWSRIMDASWRMVSHLFWPQALTTLSKNFSRNMISKNIFW